MSLPPGFLDELRSRTSLSQVVGRKVMWDPRKSNQGKGDLWAPCPFHQEKTASFHVDDRKGYYYCFGCHAKGDAISFVRETENLGFMEAVEVLAGECGLAMPERDPQAGEKADRRGRLADVMEAAVRYYRRQLSAASGRIALEYLEGRDLRAATRDRFDIGFAPDARQGLLRHLTEQGVPEDMVVSAGLAARPDDGGAPYDRFRNRIIFPIRDPRGRCIALGGRAMDPNARAKYLNSPETDLFDKGRSLYNHGPAREAAGKGAPLIVAEGYVDVIALAEAGFGATVAPLGTAITESQLQLLWRIAPEPVIALDGDTAGLRAAMRLIDLALPAMEAGQGLRFALMPADSDPDDVIRKGGAPAMQRHLDAALPMIDLLWRRETEGKSFDSPERRAALDRRLQTLSAAIKDSTLRHHYRDALRQMQWALGRPARGTRKGKIQVAQQPLAGTRQSALAADDPYVGESLREAVILAVILKTPAVLDEFEDALSALELRDPGHAAIRDALLDWRANPAGDVQAAVAAAVGTERLENLFARPQIALVPAVRAAGNVDQATLCVAEELAKLAARRGLEQEVREASEDPAGFAEERTRWRLAQATEAHNRAGRLQVDDRSEFDTSANGARLNRDERSAFDTLIRGIDYSKGRQG